MIEDPGWFLGEKGAEARRSHTLLAAGYARQIEELAQPLRQSDRPLVPLSGEA